ncbi:MAG: Glycosyl transferase [candidate division Kazan bacterium GW2011_GWB1_52_7]|nr:MAG: Glycosyl transferase [candidate division Kazan bacterium GW2011_GWB1_52_7]
MILITRWLWHSRHLLHWDSVQFALAMNQFDVSQHQPHPPGYIVYVYLGKLFQLIWPDPNIALIILSIISSVVAFCLVVLLVQRWFGKTAGIIAGLLFLTNPLVWFHGLVAEVYIVEAAAALVVVWLADTFLRTRHQKFLWWMIVALGALGGIRQSTEVVLLPLLVYVLVTGGVWRQMAWKVLAGLAAVNLIWFVPVVTMSGGLASYLTALWRLTRATISDEYGLQGLVGLLITNFAFTMQILRQALLPGLLILLLAVLPFIAEESKKKYRIDWSGVRFWLAVILPGLLIIPLILVKNSGYMLTITVFLLGLVAAAIVLLARVVGNWRTRYRTPIAAILTAIVLGFQSWAFFALPVRAFYYVSASINSIRTIDDDLDEVMSTIEKNFPPNESAVWVTGDYVFFGQRHFQYYLPEYDVYTVTPKSFVDYPERPIWHVRGKNVSDFSDKLTLTGNVRYLVFIRQEIFGPADDYQQIVKDAPDAPLAYYNLDDADTREFLRNKYNNYFVIERD